MVIDESVGRGEFGRRAKVTGDVRFHSRNMECRVILNLRKVELQGTGS